MMEAGLVSVVLPIYNVEKYLDRCVESIVNQTYRNLEIILIDDGSLDGCPQKCDEWARKDERIKVIHKANAGLGYARNTGIENATGEYICFVDSDDYIALDTIEKAYHCAKENNVEVVLFGFNNVDKKGKTVNSIVPNVLKNVYRDEEILEYVLPNLIAPNTSTGEFTNLWMSVWGGLYSMKLIDRTDWRCVSEREIISEDVYSLLWLYKDVRGLAIISEALYFYCENDTSLTHTYKPDRFERIKYFYKACTDACDELGYTDKVKQRLSYPFISNTIAVMKMIFITDMTISDKKTAFRTICKDKQLHEIVENMDIGKEKATRKMLLFFLKHRMYGACELLVRLKA